MNQNWACRGLREAVKPSAAGDVLWPESHSTETAPALSQAKNALGDVSEGDNAGPVCEGGVVEGLVGVIIITSPLGVMGMVDRSK